MIIGIIGSRTLINKEMVTGCINEAIKRHKSVLTKCFMLPTGNGVSKIAYTHLDKKFDNIIKLRAAHEIYKCIRYYPELYKARNLTIIENCDLIVTIWERKTKEMVWTIKKSLELKKELYLYMNGKLVENPRVYL